MSFVQARWPQTRAGLKSSGFAEGRGKMQTQRPGRPRDASSREWDAVSPSRGARRGPGMPQEPGERHGRPDSLSEPAEGTGSANALMLRPSASSTTWQRVPVGGASSRPPWASDEPPDACVLTSAHFNSGYTPLLTLRFLSSCPGLKSCKWPRLIVLPVLDAVGGQCPQTQSSA